MINQGKVFKSFKELGSFLQKKRRLKGDKIDYISSNLIIKKQILKNIEEGSVSEIDFYNNPHLKGFLFSYIKYLKCDEECKIENLFLRDKKSIINKQKVSLESGLDRRNSYGSLIILFSLLLVGLLYLLWNKDTYKQLYNLGLMID